MSPNIGILLNGVLRPTPLNNPFASCSSINLDFLLLYMRHFDNNNVLPYLVFKTFEFIFHVLLLLLFWLLLFFFSIQTTFQHVL